MAELRCHAFGKESWTLYPKRSVSWSDSVSRPWGMISAEIGPHAASFRLMPKPGDWVELVIGGEVVAWGRVTSPGDLGLGLSDTSPVPNDATITALSWFAALEPAQVVASTTRVTQIGTLLPHGQWAGDWSKLIDPQVSQDNIGIALSLAFKQLARIELPPSMGGGTIADRISVVYDAEAGERIGRVVEPIAGYGFTALHSLTPVDTTVMELLTGTFLPDRRLVELFPSVDETRTYGKSSKIKVHSLIYRHKPVRAAALSSVLSQSTGSSQRPLNALEKETFKAFSKPSFKAESAVRVPFEDIENISATNDDSRRCNAVGVGWIGVTSVPEWVTAESAGLPAVDLADIRGNGLRMTSIYWPFGNREAYRDGGGLADMRIIASLGAQVLFNGHIMRSGKATLTRMRRDIRHGEPIVLGNLTAYVDKVEHHVALQGETPVGSTAVTFTHGLYPWEEDARTPVITLGETSKTPEIGAPVARKKANTAPKKIDGIIHDGKIYPVNLVVQNRPVDWDRDENPFPVRALPGVWWLPIEGITADKRQNANIRMAVLHHSASALDSNEESLHRYFQLFYDNNAANPALELRSTHFAIGPEGKIYQYIDTAYPAWHSGVKISDNFWLDSLTIGVELINPVHAGKASVTAAQVAAKAAASPELKPSRASKYRVSKNSGNTGETDTWTVNGRVFTDYFSPSEAQIDALALLFATLRGIGKTNGWSFDVNGRGPANVNGRTDAAIGPERAAAAGASVPGVGKGWSVIKTLGDPLTLPVGIYHHAELLAGKFDSIGVEISDLVARIKRIP